IAEEVERYLRTGHTDPHLAAWPRGFLQCARRAHDDLRNALVREVRRLADGRTPRALPDADTVALTRRKVEPMVRGLFPRVEQDAVLAMLEKSVVFVTGDNVEQLVREHAYDSSAWDLANLYLASVGAELLGENAPLLVGLSEATTCYVSPEYFAGNKPFADFIVHEAAHIFHNCKRRTVGLPETRWREWLLDIEFRKRETFAYSCEAYSRVLERASTTSERRQLAADFGATVRISDERVDATEVAELVREAAASRNGWKAILAQCASNQRPLSSLSLSRESSSPQSGMLSQAPSAPSPARQRRSRTGATG
ncbi:MAG TPA: hypothetical protein VEZ71_11300, partial [Archangium sp.]|nr:hypothetical protein [Archangium sp.]